MATIIYAGDRIRRKNFLHISDPLGFIGCFGVAASCDTWLVWSARFSAPLPSRLPRTLISR